MKNTAKPASPAPAEKQLTEFISKFEPPIAKQIRAASRVLRQLYPTANELVYDNYNFFVIGYCATERPSDCLFSIAANSKGVGLSFYHGATLPDPHKILLGSGNQNRFIRLESIETLSRPEVKELMTAAVAQADPPLPSSGRGHLIIRSVAAKQKPRRLSAKR